MILARKHENYSKQNIREIKLVQGKYGKKVFLLDNTRIGISWNTIVVPVVQPWGNFTAKIGMQFDTLRTELRFFFFVVIFLTITSLSDTKY